MSAQTGIEWCDSSLMKRPKPSMFCAMAWLAKCDAITNLKSKFREFREWFDVMTVQVPASAITAVLAGEVVSKFYIVGPAFRSVGHALSMALDATSVNKARRVNSPASNLSHGTTDFGSLDRRSTYASLLTDEATRSPHSALGGIRKANALPVRPGKTAISSHHNPSAALAFRRQAVVSTALPVEQRPISPLLALGTPLLSGAAKYELGHGHIRLFGGNFQSSIWSLCHG